MNGIRLLVAPRALLSPESITPTPHSPSPWDLRQGVPPQALFFWFWGLPMRVQLQQVWGELSFGWGRGLDTPP